MSPMRRKLAVLAAGVTVLAALVAGSAMAAADSAPGARYQRGAATARSAGATAATTATADRGGRPDKVIRVLSPAGPLKQLDLDDNGSVEDDGDMAVFRDPLLNRKGKQVGSTQVQCQTIFGNDQCIGTATLNGRGQIAYQGTAEATNPVRLAVTGGTGEFRKAHGELQIEFPDEGDVLTLTFLLYLR